MAIQVKGLERSFKYKENTLSDPNPSLSPLEVMKFYSNTYPELTNSAIIGPHVKEDKAVYEFKLSIGTKG